VLLSMHFRPCTLVQLFCALAIADTASAGHALVVPRQLNTCLPSDTTICSA
jgi:hypothetical protein